MFEPIKDNPDLVIAAALKGRYPAMIWLRGAKGSNSTVGALLSADFSLNLERDSRVIRLDRVVAKVGDQELSYNSPADDAQLFWVPKAAPAGLFAIAWSDELPDQQTIMREAMRSARSSGFLLMRVVEWCQVIDQYAAMTLYPMEIPAPENARWKPLRPVYEPHDATLVIWAASPPPATGHPQMVLTDTSGNKMQPVAVKKARAAAPVTKPTVSTPVGTSEVHNAVSAMLRSI